MLEPLKYKGIEIHVADDQLADLISPFSEEGSISTFPFYLALRAYRQHHRILKEYGYDESPVKNIGMLYALGSVEEGIWKYKDGIARRSVQEWVDQNDSTYKVLLLHCCNPGNLDISSANSWVMHPRGIIRAGTAAFIWNEMRLYDPSRGYIPSRSYFAI